MIGEIPVQMDWITLRRRLVEIRNALNALTTAANPPRPVINLSATAQAGAILVMFTRTDGDNYTLYWNTTPSLDGATRIDLGNKGEYTDNIGASAVTRYYYVKAKKGNLESAIAGPVFETTLALDVEIIPPSRPQSTDEPVLSVERGYPVEK